MLQGHGNYLETLTGSPRDFDLSLPSLITNIVIIKKNTLSPHLVSHCSTTLVRSESIHLISL